MSKPTFTHQTLSYLNSFRRRVFRSDAFNSINEAIAHDSLPQSVFFFTTHKCASVFVPKILSGIQKNSNQTLKFRDYARELWSLGDRVDLSAGYEPFLEDHHLYLYRSKGYLYGPQRKAMHFDGIDSFRKVFFLRDPRDVIVSSFFSFGGSHSLPLNLSERNKISAQKNVISQLNIDEYAIDYALPEIKQTFNSYVRMIENTHSDDIHLCKYNEFTANPSSFILKIANFCGVDNDKMYSSALRLGQTASPVRTRINNSNHKRDGSSNQFQSKLQSSTVNTLNSELESIIKYFNFDLS